MARGVLYWLSMSASTTTMTQTGSGSSKGTRGKEWASLRQRTKRLAIPLTPEEETVIKDHTERNNERSVAEFARRTLLERISGAAVGAAEAPEYVRLAWDATTRALVEAANARAEAAGELVRRMLGELWMLRKLEEQMRILVNPKVTPAEHAAAIKDAKGTIAALDRSGPREEYVK